MARDKQPPPKKKRSPAYYWWALANVLALCLAVLSWVLCLHIFRHPEIPRNYSLLRQLGRVEPPAALTAMEAPSGEAADPRAFYRRYAGLDEKALAKLNAALLRNYLLNFTEKKLIQYAEGDYRVEEVRKLGAEDLFHPGFAVRARAMISPDEFTAPLPWPVVLEYLFPTADEDAPGWIGAGDLLTVAKYPNCAVLLHVERVRGEDAPELVLTVAPVAFGEFEAGKGRKFTLAAPAELNPSAAFPVFSKDPEID